MASAPPPAAVIPLGARVQVPAGEGIVRFVGPTAFAAGKWVGVELDNSDGKNDGSVAGTRYFSCEQGHGVFVRASIVSVLGAENATAAERPASRASTTDSPAAGGAGTRPPSRPLSTTSARPRSSLLPAAPGSRPPSTTTAASSSSSRPVSAASSHASSAGVGGTANSSRPTRPPGSPTKAPRPSGVPTPGSTRPPSRATGPLGAGTATSATGTRRTSMLPPPTPRARPTASTGLVPPAPRGATATPRARAADANAASPATARKAPPINFAPPPPPASPSPSPAGTTPRPSRAGAGPTAASAAAGAPRRTPGMGAGAGAGTAVARGGPPPSSTMRRTLSTSSSLSAASAASSTSSVGRAPSTSAASAARRPPLGRVAGARPLSTDEDGAHGDGDDGLDLETADPDVGPAEDDRFATVRAKRPPPPTAAMGARGPGASVSALERRAGAAPEPSDPFSLRNTEARRPLEATVPQRLYDELAAKLSIVERRRAEDRDKLRDYDRLVEEQGEWERVREKTKARVAELAGEVKELKRENKDLQAERDAAQSELDDLQAQVEHSLLDKEIAESELEEVQAKVQELEERLGEVQVELEVVKEENARLEGLGDAEIQRAREGQDGGEGAAAVQAAPSSLAFRQLEKHNARLKEALLRLRDLTSENEAEMKRKIENLEKEVDLTSDLQGDLDNMAVELEAAEVKIEELRSQLDVAAEAQDMLEELTERNLRLQDDNEVLKADVEELEALKELADELEESHVATEKQLQDELDLRDLQLQDVRRRAALTEDNCADYEATIGQFRELVASLQADLEHLRQQQQTQETQSQMLTSQSQAMLNLNLKLQSTVLKSQVKAIDLELRELEAEQAAAHLAIVKPYLLPSFFEADSDAVEALLFFDRIASKVALLARYIEQKHDVGEALDGTVPDDLVAICEARSKLVHFAALNRRFAATLKRCPPEVFVTMGGAHREVASTEKRIDAYVEALRKEDLNEMACAKDLEGLVSQTEHLTASMLQGLDPQLDLLEREMAYVGSLDLDLDTIAVAAGASKQTVAALTQDPDVQLELNGGDLDDALFKPLQNLVNSSRNAKVLAKKLHRRLDELKAANSASSPDHAQGLETLAYNSAAIASALSKLAGDFRHYCGEVRASKEVLELSTLHGVAKEIVAVELGKQSPRPLDEINGLLAQLVQDMGTALATLMDAEHVVQLSYTAPWTARVAELHARAAVDVGAEKDVARLTDELRVVTQDLRVKDQECQEGLVKIELMEKRLEAVKKQAEVMAQLEADLAKSRKQERTYEEANEVLQRDLDSMERELHQLKQSVPGPNADVPGAAASALGGVDLSTAYEGNMETAHLLDRIAALRNAVKFLRSENAYLKSHDLLSDLDALPTCELPPTPPRSPEPSAEADSSAAAFRRPSAGLPWVPTSAGAGAGAVVPPESFAVRSKRLLREARLLSCTPRLVELPRPPAVVADDAPSAAARGGAGGSRRRDPRQQLWAEKERARRLEQRLVLLQEESPQGRWRRPQGSGPADLVGARGAHVRA
ncbi:hypothetical protein JCM8202_002336 [Rhodotorula sphaerocarpa]